MKRRRAGRVQRGFTIVELLIIIAIIGIIATIVAVTYKGVQDRARSQVARADMREFAQATTLFKIHNGRSPVTATDFSEVLKDAEIYDTTRTTDKSYAICADSSGFAFVAWEPIIGGLFRGDILYLYSEDNGQTTHVLTNSSLNSTNTIDKVCDQVYPSSTLDIWTYSVP